ncbi:TetR family transcriptional regulator [Rhodococcus sp. NPDC058521]|uniref:TetR family transcriptional regulator n=1 Tax=Rhodococcus sp. NPDC058521 TaxID=3346536 RepID=UPI00364FACD9
MARQQERARRTRAALVESAALEFARRGYSAASVNTILEGSHTTKGAMYFHFQSKEDLARAVLEAGVEQFTELTARWSDRVDLDPFVVLHALLRDLARMFDESVIAQAEFRLIIEPEFYSEVQSGGSQVWGRTAYALARRASEMGLLREGADPGRFTRVLAATLAGQRYMTDLTALDGGLEDRFLEALGVVLDAMAAPEWLAKLEAEGWPEIEPDLPRETQET